MKKALLFIFCIILSQQLTSQELTVGASASLTINQNVSLNVRGLEITPSSVFAISNNTITYSGTPLDINGAASIARSYSISNPFLNYVGEIVVHYEDSELGGLTEAGLLLSVENDSNVWGSYTPTIDTNLNTVGFDFVSPISFLSVTATNDVPLSVEDLNGNLTGVSVYPNPTNSRLTIKSNTDVTTELFDVLGKSILKSSNETIDVLNLENAIYILKVTETETGKTKTFRVIKE